jgi:hypothetical protein
MQATNQTTGVPKRGPGRPRGKALPSFTMHMKIARDVYRSFQRAAKRDCLPVHSWARRTMLLAVRKSRKST